MVKLYVGMTGIRIRVDTGIDLGNASKVALKVRKPSGTEVEWVGTANGTAIEYVVHEGDFDEAGYYKIQAYAEFGSSMKLYGETEGLYIYEKFE